MGRFFVYSLILVLAAFVLTTSFILKGGGDPSAAVMQVSVHDLSVAPQAHAQELVTTRGVLRLVQEPTEHFLITADGLAIIVRGYDIRELRKLVEQNVVVIGRFGFDAVNGTYIKADSITPIQ